MRNGLSVEREQQDFAEAELLRNIARGDEKAFAALYDRYSAILFGLLLRILHSRAEAEDVLQEVFLQVWRRASTFDAARGRAFTWLVTLARSRAIDRLRASNSRERVVAQAAASSSSSGGGGQFEFETSSAGDAVEDAIRSEESAVVRGALARIPEEQRRALLLAYVEGLTQTEIAARLQQPLGTVKTRMRAGMSKLREILREKTGGARPDL